MTEQQWTFDPAKAAAQMVSIYSAETDHVATSAMEKNNESVEDQLAVAPDVAALGNHDNHGSGGGDVDPVNSYLNWSQGSGGSPAKNGQQEQHRIFEMPPIERVTVTTDVQVSSNHDNRGSVGGVVDAVNSYPNWSQSNGGSPAQKRPYANGQHWVSERPSIERGMVATDAQVPNYHGNHGSVGGVMDPVGSYPSWSQGDGGTPTKKRSFTDRIFKGPPVDAVETEDDNYQFLVSLLPYLRDVPKHRKLIVRHRLQKVLIDEENTVYVPYSKVPSCTSNICDNTCFNNVPGNNCGPNSEKGAVALVCKI